MPERHIMQQRGPAAVRRRDNPARGAALNPRRGLHHRAQHSVLVVTGIQDVHAGHAEHLRAQRAAAHRTSPSPTGQRPPLQFMVTGVFFEQLLGRR